jgi:ribonucleoside-diphosphate reductase alpha chain
LPFEARSALGIYTAAERERQLETGSYDQFEEVGPEAVSQDVAIEPERRAMKTSKAVGNQVHSPADLIEVMQGRAADAPICMTCGTKMRPSGSCHVCEGCGSTSGCS